MFEIAIGALIVPFIWYGLTTLALRRYRLARNPIYLWPAQISVFGVLGVLISGLLVPDEGWVILLILTVLFPPIVFLGLIALPFLMVTLLPIGLLTLLCASISRKTRAWAPLLATLAMFISVPITGDIYWDRQMCARAAALELTDVRRPPFMHNLRRANSKSGREPYAIAQKDGEVWDWGYTREDFVRYGGDIPEWAEMSRFEPLECPPSPQSRAGSNDNPARG